ncbi:MAG: SUKH-4 family immunity protein [Pyrinomonadaceae bacterium]
MKPSEFIERWHAEDEPEPLLRFTPQSLVGVSLYAESLSFLLEAGLPAAAAPFLTFEVPEEVSLPTAAEAWQLPEAYSCFRVIGFNGSGDPLCLDESAAGAVVHLNHDNEFERVLMNSSVPQLAESLLVFRSFVQGGASAELEAWCIEELRRVDEAAWVLSSFWRDEMSMMKS